MRMRRVWPVALVAVAMAAAASLAGCSTDTVTVGPVHTVAPKPTPVFTPAVLTVPTKSRGELARAVFTTTPIPTDRLTIEASQKKNTLYSVYVSCVATKPGQKVKWELTVANKFEVSSEAPCDGVQSGAGGLQLRLHKTVEISFTSTPHSVTGAYAVVVPEEDASAG